MYYYKIKNKKTKQTAEVIAYDFQDACRIYSWQYRDCEIVWMTSIRNAPLPPVN